MTPTAPCGSGGARRMGTVCTGAQLNSLPTSLHQQRCQASAKRQPLGWDTCTAGTLPSLPSRPQPSKAPRAARRGLQGLLLA